MARIGLVVKVNLLISAYKYTATTGVVQVFLRSYAQFVIKGIDNVLIVC